MNTSLEDTLRLARLLVERLENIDLELLEALSGPNTCCLDELLAHRQECIASLANLDHEMLKKLDREDKTELIRKIKGLEKSGRRLIEQAHLRCNEIARARRQNAVARRAARGYKPPVVKLVVNRRAGV